MFAALIDKLFNQPSTTGDNDGTMTIPDQCGCNLKRAAFNTTDIKRG